VVIDRQKAISRIIFTGLALKVVLNLIMIPLWGYMGSAVGVIISECLVFALFYWNLRRELDHPIRLFRFFAFPVLAMGALYAVALVLQNALVSGRVFAHQFLSSLGYAVIIALVVTVLYLALVRVTGTIDRAGLQQLNSLLQVETDDND
jgi:peptidoglycan biosynthesis protein MviN/MurJ (putative lipid II flippase)